MSLSSSTHADAFTTNFNAAVSKALSESETTSLEGIASLAAAFRSGDVDKSLLFTLSNSASLVSNLSTIVSKTTNVDLQSGALDVLIQYCKLKGGAKHAAATPLPKELAEWMGKSTEVGTLALTLWDTISNDLGKSMAALARDPRFIVPFVHNLGCMFGSLGPDARTVAAKGLCAPFRAVQPLVYRDCIPAVELSLRLLCEIKDADAASSGEPTESHTKADPAAVHLLMVLFYVMNSSTRGLEAGEVLDPSSVATIAHFLAFEGTCAVAARVIGNLAEIEADADEAEALLQPGLLAALSFCASRPSPPFARCVGDVAFAWSNIAAGSSEAVEKLIALDFLGDSLLNVGSEQYLSDHGQQLGMLVVNMIWTVSNMLNFTPDASVVYLCRKGVFSFLSRAALIVPLPPKHQDALLKGADETARDALLVASAAAPALSDSERCVAEVCMPSECAAQFARPLVEGATSESLLHHPKPLALVLLRRLLRVAPQLEKIILHRSGLEGAEAESVVSQWTMNDA